MPAFEWAPSSPKIFSDVNLRMTDVYESKNHLVDFYPFEEKLCKGIRPEDILLVDVGGGWGKQCVAFKRKLWRVPGRVINQDETPVISQASQYDGVEHQSNDFMEDQPVKGNLSLYHGFGVLSPSLTHLQELEHTISGTSCTIILMTNAC